MFLPWATIPAKREFHEAFASDDHLAEPDPLYSGLSCFEPAAFARNWAVAERLIRRLQTVGKAKIVLLEVPWLDDVLASEYSRGRAEQKAAYSAAIRRCAREAGVQYVDVRAAARWTPADFADY